MPTEYSESLFRPLPCPLSCSNCTTRRSLTPTCRFILGGVSVEAVQTSKSLQVTLQSRETEESVFLKLTRKSGLIRRHGLTIYADNGISLLFRLGQVCLGRRVYQGGNPRVEVVVSGLEERQRICIRPGL